MNREEIDTLRGILNVLVEIKMLLEKVAGAEVVTKPPKPPPVEEKFESAEEKARAVLADPGEVFEQEEAARDNA